MTQTWEVVLSIASGAVGAAVIGLIGGFVGSWIQSRREHEKWLRQQRLAVYTQTLQWFEYLWWLDAKQQKHFVGSEQYARRQSEIIAAVRLLGKDSVSTALVQWELVATKPLNKKKLDADDRSAYDDGQEPVLKAMRKALKVDG